MILILNYILEEWIDYHLLIGFNRFYLYDNSKVMVNSDKAPSEAPSFIPGKVNNHGISYDDIIKFTDEEINTILEMIQVKYSDKIIIKEWSPKDKDGNIIFNQIGAHNNCLKLLKYDNVKWCANIDINEFIVLNDNYRNINEYLDK